MEEVLKFLSENNPFYFATVDGAKPKSKAVWLFYVL
ncbi:hypothetical protein Psch_00677 [Pelotomaculum schinkii]|uniref:Pyridoxamine 5'-phosphate oxidase n=1 Tax=Pelotomaculum schinkii TaxID=78350 RepID=A0A4Y7RDR5_9FIRM|nr:hypothetical protein Psch_00677 [Pelotomaculum schinkii]